MYPWWELPDVRPGGMAASAAFAMYQRREFRSEEKVVLTARLINWRDLCQVKVDRVKMIAGEDVPTTLLKADLPTGKAGRFA